MPLNVTGLVYNDPSSMPPTRGHRWRCASSRLTLFRMLTFCIGLAVTSLATVQVAPADVPGVSRIEMFADSVLTAIKPDGQIDPLRFDCQAFLQSDNSTDLLDCLDQRSGIRSLWASEPATANRPAAEIVAASVAFLSRSGLPDDALSSSGDFAVSGQEDFDDLKANVAKIRKSFIVRLLGECEFVRPPQSKPSEDGMVFAVRNPERDTQIIFSFSGWTFETGTLDGDALHRPSDGSIVATFLIANLDTPCTPLENPPSSAD